MRKLLKTLYQSDVVLIRQDGEWFLELGTFYSTGFRVKYKTHAPSLVSIGVSLVRAIGSQGSEILKENDNYAYN